MNLSKRISLLGLAAAATLAAWADGKPYVSQVWSPDLGNGQYINPIIDADYSDPDVVRVGDDYYMTASSFCDIPGLPVLHSKDLSRSLGTARSRPQSQRNHRHLPLLG